MKTRFTIIASILAMGGWLGYWMASEQFTFAETQDQSTPAKANGSILPFPPTPSASKAGPTLPKPGAPAEVVIVVDGKEAVKTTVKRTVPAAFTASETFDVGVDLGSPVSLDYFDRAPFKFNGKIEKVEVELK